MASLVPPKPFGTLPFEALTGVQKAATILLVLGDERGAQVMSKLDESELTQVTRVMASAGRLQPSLVSAVCKDFLGKFDGGDVSVGSVSSAQRMLLQFLPPDRVEAIMAEIVGPSGRTTWEKLTNVNPETLANYLMNENSETAALVLSRLRSDHAARILEAFPRAKVLEVVTCMMTLDSVPADAIQEVEEVLRNELMANFTKGQGGASPDDILAEIFNRTNRDTLSYIFSDIGMTNPEEIERIKAKMFTFEDLAQIDDGDLATLLRAVDGATLALSLKDQKEEARERFFGVLPQRSATMLRDEFSLLGKVRARDVQEAQAAVLEKAKELEAAGEIRLKTESEDDRLID